MLFGMAVNSIRVARESAVIPNQRRFEVQGGAAEGGAVRVHGSRRVWLGLMAAMLLPGCAKVSGLIGSKPVELELLLQVSAKVNPDSRQRPSPILVRFYELKEAAAFNRADFVSLFQRDEALLGGDLLAREEHVLQPSERRPLKRALNAQTRFLAVFAAYRDLERAYWRAVLPVQDKRPWQVTVLVDELMLTMVPAA